ncbi:MAG TPA: PIN domain-containing protein [Actinomycetota bacterium]
MGARPAGGPCPGGSGASALDRLILDTTILIAAERRRGGLDASIDDDDDVAIAAITAAELLVGIELADSKRRRSRQRYVEALLSTIPVEPYDLDVARAHAVLLAHTRRSGRARGAHDLLIAATALARGRTVVTADQQGFEDLPGVLVKG